MFTDIGQMEIEGIQITSLAIIIRAISFSLSGWESLSAAGGG